LNLAFYGVAVAALGVVVAATTGVATLQAWGVSTAALALAIGTVLLIVGLRAVLSVYGPQVEYAAPDDGKPLPSAKDLPFSPLAFPTILPPFGVGIVVLLLSLAEERGAMQTMAVLILVVLALDLLAMLAADWIMRAPFVKFALRIVGAIMGILQVALAFQVIADAVRDLNVL
jgi:multiple antibiotic resistance protein